MAFEETVTGYMRERGLDPGAGALSAMLRDRGYEISAEELSRQLLHQDEADPSVAGAISAVLGLGAEETDALARAIFRDARADLRESSPARGQAPPQAPPREARPSRPASRG